MADNNAASSPVANAAAAGDNGSPRQQQQQSTSPSTVQQQQPPTQQQQSTQTTSPPSDISSSQLTASPPITGTGTEFFLFFRKKDEILFNFHFFRSKVLSELGNQRIPHKMNRKVLCVKWSETLMVLNVQNKCLNEHKDFLWIDSEIYEMK